MPRSSDDPAGRSIAATAPRDNIAPEFFGYVVEGVLGVGGFGSVYSARRGRDGERVAIKLARRNQPIAATRLAREADALRSIGPPHVPQVIETGALADGSPYLVMELVAAPTLAEQLVHRPAELAAEFYPLAAALLANVAAVHAVGLIHRDLKPENMFVLRDPLRSKLIDLGLVASSHGGGIHLTPTGVVQGTAEYMAPEQCGGSSEVDHRADIYALGVVLYEIVTGRPPFLGSAAEIHYAHRERRPPPPSDLAGVARPLEDVLLRCLAKRPQARFDSAAQLATALRAARGGDDAHSGIGDRGARTSGPAAAALQPSEQTAALVYFETVASISLVQDTFARFAGTLAHIAGRRGVAVFLHDGGSNPVRMAVRAATELTRDRRTRNALVEVGRVQMQDRFDGHRRFVSPLFTHAGSFLTAADPEGVVVTTTASEAMRELAVEPVPGRPGLWLLATTHGRTGVTAASAPPLLIGRAAVLDPLLAQARAALDGHAPKISTVLGEPGAGKSHLAAELANRLRLESRTVIQVQAREPISGVAHDTLRALLRSGLELSATTSRTAGRARLARQIGHLGQDVVLAAELVLDWMEPSDPRLVQLAAAPGALSRLAGQAAGEVLRRMAAERPVCVVLDDAQYADRPALDALNRAALADDLPLWVCVVATAGFAHAMPWRNAHPPIHLGPLDPADAAILCRRLLRPAEDVPETAIQQLVQRTHGVPLLLVELVAGLKRDGLIKPRANGRSWVLVTDELDRLPDLPVVQWMTQRTLESLPRDLLAHARLCALVAKRFRAAEIQGVLRELDKAGLGGEFSLDGQVGIRRLIAEGILIEHEDGWIAFRVGMLRDVLEHTTAGALRVLVDQAAVRFYREPHTLAAAERLPRLALHSERAGLRAEAAQLYLALAERCFARHAYLDAEAMYSSALDQLEASDDALRLRALKGRGVVRYRITRHDDALADLLDARELARRTGDREAEADILFDAAMALDWLYEWTESKRMAEQARDLMAGCAQPLLQARLAQALGRSACRFNNYAEGIELLEQAARIAEPLGDLGYEIVVVSLVLAGFVLPFVGRLAEAERCLERVIALCQDNGDELHLGAAYGNRLCLWIAVNDRDRLVADLDKLIVHARSLGNLFLERNANVNAAYFFHWRGEPELAEPYAHRAIELNERSHRFGDRPDAAVLLARIRWARDDVPGCRALVHQVRSHQDRARCDDTPDSLLAPNDQMLLDMISLAADGGSGAEWDAVVERAHRVAEGQELIEVLETRAVVAERQGDRARARQALEIALAACQRIPSLMTERIRRRLASHEPR